MLVYGIDLHKPPGEGRPCTWNIAPALSLYFRLRSGCSFSNEHWNYPNSQAAKWSKNEATEMSTYFFRTKSWIEGHKCNQAYIYIYIEHHRTWLNQQQTNFNATTSRTWKCTGVEWNPTVHWWCNLENIVKTRRYPTEERERKGGYLMLLGAILLVTNLKVEHLHGVDLSSSSEPSTVNLQQNWIQECGPRSPNFHMLLVPQTTWYIPISITDFSVEPPFLSRWFLHFY
jgi:hypothetical protein